MLPSKKLTVLFAPLDSAGHVNACHGLADVMASRGHRVVFAVDHNYQGQLAKHGFEVYPIRLPGDDQGADPWADFVYKYKDVYRRPPIEVLGTSTVRAFTMMYNNYRSCDDQYKKILLDVNPDLIVIDSYIGSPTLTHLSGKPWVWLCSAAPQSFMHSLKIPPACSGLPLDGNRQEWQQFRDKYNDIFRDLHQNISKWFVSTGAPALNHPNKASILHPDSPYLNIYIYPQELDYQDQLYPLQANWHRIDGSIRTTNEKFELPEPLASLPGKLIFFTIGSYGASNLDLMTRLTTILGKSKHRFIVAKGPLHDRYELPPNQWGAKYVPQTALLPMVDLVIAHGGNNTLTEAFYYGKPLLVLPMSSDQLDNAQRIQEVGLGRRLSPYYCTDDELLAAVDEMVNDQVLADRMAAIGRRVRTSNDRLVVSEMMERLVN